MVFLLPGWWPFSAFLFVFALFIAYLFVVFFFKFSVSISSFQVFLSPYLTFKCFFRYVQPFIFFLSVRPTCLLVFPFKSLLLYVLSSISVSISTFQVFKFVCLPFQVFMSVCLSFQVFPSVCSFKYFCLNIYLSSL